MTHVPALQGQLLWDDGFLVRDNPFIRSPLFVLEVFRHHLFLDSFSAHYRPVQNLSMMFDYLIWSNNTFGYHLTNVLLHVGAGILLYFLSRKLIAHLCERLEAKLSPALPGVVAFCVAMLWVVHPVHSAAVDYMSGRADSLAFLFACAGWLLFLRARKHSRRIGRILFYCLAWFSGLMALCSRENGCLWIIIFLLYLFAFYRPVAARWKWPVFGACILLLASYAVLHELPTTRGTTGGSYGWPPVLRSVLMLRALGDYTGLMVFPSNLHMERTVFDPAPMVDLSARSAGIRLEYLSIIGFATLLAFLWLSCRRGPGQRLRILGASWFILTYLPISNLFDLNATVAEHWLYLPSVGFLFFLAGCVLDLPPRFQRGVLAFASIAVLALSVRTFVRSSDWVSDITFYERTLAAGGSSSRVLGNLAQLYTSRGDYVKAEALFREVLKMSPEYPIARNNLAEALARQGKKKAAEALLASTSKETEQTRKDYPRTWIPVINLALYHQNDGDTAGALAIAEKARRDYPGVWEIIRFEANLLHETQSAAAAVPLLESFTRENWWHHEAAVTLGRFYGEAGEERKAEAILHLATWLDVYEADALCVLAEMRLRHNQLNEAYAIEKRAIARQPDQPRQYILLSNILDKMGRNDEARAALAHVTQLRTLASSDKALD